MAVPIVAKWSVPVVLPSRLGGAWALQFFAIKYQMAIFIFGVTCRRPTRSSVLVVSAHRQISLVLAAVDEVSEAQDAASLVVVVDSPVAAVVA
jgi:hypothetical protein